jgi:potassium efflux system protein
MERRVTHSLVNALRAVPSFAGVDDHVLLELIGDSANLYWPAGSLVFERGTPADGLYVVVAGAVSVLDDDGGVIASLEPGDFFGELSLLLGTAHQRAVRVDEPAELMVIPKERFDELISSHPVLGTEIRRRAEERMAASAQRGAPAAP